MSIAAGPATSTVLGTTELLEIILSDLRCNDLMIARNASRGWRNLTSRSIVLQQNLFVMPIPNSYKILKRRELGELLTGAKYLGYIIWTPVGFVLAQTHPVLQKSPFSGPRYRPRTWIVVLDDLVKFLRRPAIQNMLVTQPPCSSIALRITRLVKLAEVNDEGGIRFSTLNAWFSANWKPARQRRWRGDLAGAKVKAIDHLALQIFGFVGQPATRPPGSRRSVIRVEGSGA